MNIFVKEARRLIAAGADPRQAGSAATAHFGLPRVVGFWDGLKLGAVLGAFVLALVGAGLGWAFDLRPASQSRLGPVAFSGSEDPKPSEDTIQTSDLAYQDMLGQVAVALRSVPDAERATALADLVRLRLFLHDPTAMQLASAVANVSSEDKLSLAESNDLTAVLHWWATVPTKYRTAMIGLDIGSILDDAARRALLRHMPGLDMATAQLCTAVATSDASTRVSLQAVLLSLTSGSEARTRLARLAAALNARNSTLLKFVDRLPAACAPDHAGACR